MISRCCSLLVHQLTDCYLYQQYTNKGTRIPANLTGHYWTTKNPLPLLGAGFIDIIGLLWTVLWRRSRDSNPGWSYPHNGFRDRPVQPLRHSSAFALAIYAIQQPFFKVKIGIAPIRCNGGREAKRVMGIYRVGNPGIGKMSCHFGSFCDRLSPVHGYVRAGRARQAS